MSIEYLGEMNECLKSLYKNFYVCWTLVPIGIVTLKENMFYMAHFYLCDNENSFYKTHFSISFLK